ncbi:hypothetical protein FACS1894166_12330 [Bacilli bacterium]|nr:hypothetical protein FACS1894166_12330 [Bacilli bacterium]
MFQNCKNLKTLDLSKFKGKIGNSAFFGCEQLSEIIWGPGPYELGDRSFAFTGISELDIDDKFLSIDDAAFVGIQSLKKVYFNSDKCIMGNGVFRETSPCHYYFNGMHPLNSHIICTMPISDIHLHFQNKDVYVSPSMLYDLSKLEDSSNVQQIATITKEVTYPTEQTNFFNHY